MKGTKRVVLTTFGSLGDLHPFLAIGRVLRARGHDATIATLEEFRPRVESLGLHFHPIRPRFSDFGDTTELAGRMMDLKRGPEYVVRQMVMAHLRASYDDLSRAVRGADLLVTHPLVCAGPLIAEKEGLPWAATAMAPLGFFSPHDPPVIPSMPTLNALRGLGPLLFKPLFKAAQRTTWSWSDPVRALRSEIGLPPSSADPLGAGQFSPYLNLGLYSPVLGSPQPDWPANTTLTGFPFFDGSGGPPELAPDLARFLAAGPPPIVFTLGSAAVMDAGTFYRESAQAAAMLHRRAVLLVGSDPRNRELVTPSRDIALFDYAPFSALLPRAAAVVHQGGIGTTGQALRAGVPMLVVPFAFDQPDNAARVQRLGVARVLSRAEYNADRAASALRTLFGKPSYTLWANEVGREVRQERGAERAADALEALLERRAMPLDLAA